MEYKGALVAVTDMERSKRFYCDLLDMRIEGDFGANVQLSGGLYLQQLDSWKGFIAGWDVQPGGNAGELYFETQEFDVFIERLADMQVTYVHAPLMHDWGQRAVRFLDPDAHIIEVAESLVSVMKRFIKGGMTVEQVARRMDVPAEYVKTHLTGE